MAPGHARARRSRRLHAGALHRSRAARRDRSEARRGARACRPADRAAPRNADQRRGAAARARGSGSGAVIGPDLPQVTVEGFEGPLDLLLELIEERKLDILTIRLGDLADEYL